VRVSDDVGGCPADGDSRRNLVESCRSESDDVGVGWGNDWGKKSDRCTQGHTGRRVPLSRSEGLSFRYLGSPFDDSWRNRPKSLGHACSVALQAAKAELRGSFCLPVKPAQFEFEVPLALLYGHSQRRESARFVMTGQDIVRLRVPLRPSVCYCGHKRLGAT
jgi:hypothetical protein